ncbi:phenolic glucoside malonyltransferase 1 [Vigna radiata var. radiata]|uniref:Phenolic glucoside malonyltransferase 1 n=1 Tax=Vigna radiata var. radiata TaxID=3916 RepID=A0A3Q0F0J1_VIGRR|nr:phenolic glucoside malonyltransferase 1 [Vigna radiata var. radiata]
MASHNLKIHEQCTVAPPSAPQTTLPFLFFDLLWLRFHPVERIFFYSLPVTHSNPSIFFTQVVPKLKTSLSHTLQHFSPLAGNVLWPYGSPNPVIQYNPGDGVSVVLAESEADFDHALDNAPKDASESRCLLLPFPPRLEDHVRGTFVLTGADLERLKNRVMSKWDSVDIVKAESGSNSTVSSKPTKLSTFVLTCAYTFVCIANAWNGVENEKNKFGCGFTVDCRARMEPPIPENYFGNCVWGNLVAAKPSAFIEKEGFVIIAKSIHSKIKEILDKGVFHEADDIAPRYEALAKQGVEVLGTAGSNRFGVYGIDFGWGKPLKVEIASVDRALTIGLADNRDEKVGVEVGIVMKRPVMELFATLFRGGLSDE